MNNILVNYLFIVGAVGGLPLLHPLVREIYSFQWLICSSSDMTHDLPLQPAHSSAMPCAGDFSSANCRIRELLHKEIALFVKSLCDWISLRGQLSKRKRKKR